MKVEFGDNGELIISAENNTEMVALKKWSEEFTPHGVLVIHNNAHKDADLTNKKGE